MFVERHLVQINPRTLLRTYFGIALRHLRHRKLFAGLNILGLSLGMACSILIFLWVQDEQHFDRFHANAGQIYRVTATLAGVRTAVVPPVLANVVEVNLPAVEHATQLIPLQEVITADKQKFAEKRMFYTDGNFLKVFDFPLLQGDAATVLNRPDAVVVTAATAKKYFGTTAAVGRTIHIDDDIVGRTLVVTGVLRDVPTHSHLQFDLLLPMAAYERLGNPPSWDNYAAYVYLQLSQKPEGASGGLPALEAQLNQLKQQYDVTKLASTLSLQPLTRIHLHSDFTLDVAGQGNATHVFIFSLVALFILLIASVNFMNLSTALAAQRAKEIGLRKTIGAQRFQLILQFLGESLILALLSLAIAVALAFVLLPAFNTLTSKAISLQLMSPALIVQLVGTAVVVGLIAGSYPAFFLSSFRPIQVLKASNLFEGDRSSSLRNGLVVLQFSIAVILMISTLVVYTQLQYIRHRDIGFNKENLVYAYMPEVGDLRNNMAILQTKLADQPAIGSYTVIDHLPTVLSAAGTLDWPGKDPGQQVMATRLRTDDRFLKTFDIHLVAGRFFSPEVGSEDSNYVVNETAVKAMQLTSSNAIGHPLTLGGRGGTIIGVIHDFHFKPLQQPIEPLVLQHRFSSGYVVVRTGAAGEARAIASLKKVFGEVYGNYPFEYGFIDADLENLYRTEQRMGTLFNLFSVVSILIACLGLFGLTTYATQKRIKEIGVRKVLGASAAGIVIMLTKDFLRLVVFAFIVAFPAAAWMMNSWLDNYAYRIDLSWWMFAAAGFLALLIALMTVSYQSVKAALSTPTQSLRSE